jgi:hypothetical protein
MELGEKLEKRPQITEREYRKLDFLSQSDLKIFAEDRKKFYKKVILKEVVIEEDNQAMIMGNLVDILLLQPDQFDNRFVMSTCETAPTGNNLKFAEALYKASLCCLNEDGVVTKDFEVLAKEAYETAGIKKPLLPKFIMDFVGSSTEAFYQEILASRPKGLQVITAQDTQNAENIISALRTNEFIADIINLETDENTEVLNQFAVQGFDIEGIEFKGLIDKLHVHHDEKVVEPYDLKCTWNVEDFYEQYYLKRKSYLQSSVYYAGLVKLFPGYTVKPMKFIVCDSINYNNPLIYETTSDDLRDGMKGFEYNGRKYKGAIELIHDLKWHLETGLWGISRENYLNKGIVKLKK